MAEDVGLDGTLELTPTWIVALVCFAIVVVSLLGERSLHHLGKMFKRKNQKPLYEAILKIKQELMILGFISLLLTACERRIQGICIHPGRRLHMLPCQRDEEAAEAPTNGHLVAAQIIGRIGRRLLSDGATGLHVSCQLKMHQWKQWEKDAIQKDNAGNGPKKVTLLHNFEFVREHFKGIGKRSRILSWLRSFFKQIYGSVNKTNYTTMGLGFIMCLFSFSWYLWVLVVMFLLLNVNGWHAYFWIAFLPLILMLAVGTKLEHVIAQLVRDVAEKHSALEGDLIVNPSDDHVWFGRPRIVLFLIHFILLQNAFEIAFFFWILTAYGFKSCIMGHAGFVVPRLVIGLIIQILCSYCTLPLYAIVPQMGSFYKKEIFNEHVQQGVLAWAQKTKMKKEGFEKSNDAAKSANTTDSAGPSASTEMMKQAMQEGNDASETIE